MADNDSKPKDGETPNDGSNTETKPKGGETPAGDESAQNRIKELNEENKKHRLRAKELEEQNARYKKAFELINGKGDDQPDPAALEKQKAAGIPRKLVGFTMPDRAFPRHGYPVFYAGAQSGEVRSGTMSPSLGIAIGTAYLPLDAAREGTEFEIEIRGKRLPAVVQKMPFYKNASHR